MITVCCDQYMRPRYPYVDAASIHIDLYRGFQYQRTWHEGVPTVVYSCQSQDENKNGDHYLDLSISDSNDLNSFIERYLHFGNARHRDL
jgi:hypothetical protein